MRKTSQNYDFVTFHGHTVFVSIAAIDFQTRHAVDKALRKLRFYGNQVFKIKKFIAEWVGENAILTTCTLIFVRGTIEWQKFPIDVKHSFGNSKIYIATSTNTCIVHLCD